MERQWYVEEDRQGGEFGMYRLYTAEEWLDQAVNWLESDGAFEDPEDAEDILDTEDGFRAYWEDVIAKNPQDFIDYVDDYWEITMVENGVDGRDYYAEYTEYASYFNDEWCDDHRTKEEAIALVRKEIDELIESGDVDSVNFEECYVERFIDNDYDAYDADPICYYASADPRYAKYL